MKKILLASTALVATAGIAAADVSISGSAQMGFEYAEDVANTGADEATVNNEVFVTFDMSGETDGGLSFGATTVYTVASNGDPANDDTWVWVSGTWGTLSMGAVAEADEVVGLADLGLDGIGTDDVAEALNGDDATGQAHNVNYTGTFGALTLGVSAAIGNGTADFDNESYAVGAKYSFGDFYVGAGYSDHSDVAEINDDGDEVDQAAFGNHTATSVYAGGTFDAISIAAQYTTADPDGAGDDLEAYGVHVAYAMGATTITAAYSDNDLDTDASYGVGLAYDLGGGATLKGAVGSINDVNKADFGISMSF